MISIFQNYGGELLYGLGQTLLCSIIALIFALIIGSGFAIMEVMPNKFARVVAKAYIELFRNIPLLVITMFFYVVIPMYIVEISGFAAGTVGLILYSSAFIAETVRSGIQSVDPGQMEGSRANGLSFWQAMRYIVLPQAFRYVIPPLGNQFINLVKNSSVLAFVAGFDLMYQGNVIASDSLQSMSTYLCVGVLYLILTLPLSYYMRYLEKKLA
ncbi:MAG: amino acid ABC transporter permease [Lentilactobacillus diolivorans]|jgi:putative glutamine transport system permease protein|uniref:Polar amino acid ABC transporter inner membrane subunit n=2 Tax=Lentilactobacillus diolivorans TaxID=179838 RepID=A0A0R1S7L8_9LACO|nr:amino acid ABC transporter permease [Lentilactobacillus diolivorans]RRG03397.1 MAG: amino acid ABC transporter permease [Lactobacillus sp.]KRL65446.1 polar amino acid ABC transporter inner membrane subunit [Lentilactobacillus diolivorans DSM 14421]MCH4163955.1 amino acid ABC transporter permease [Lentilactobacillus diolivorans]MDH5105062.1 amino acid ABC transporter permease [Lentilactobacillus diolivorans]GEP23167.1 glutamine ABC transporter permease [Lentilactobacillus diolivorans]